MQTNIGKIRVSTKYLTAFVIFVYLKLSKNTDFYLSSTIIGAVSGAKLLLIRHSFG